MFANFGNGNTLPDEVPSVGAQDRRYRGIFSGFWVIVLAVIVTFGLFSTVLYTRCQNAFRESALAYPGADTVENQATFMAMQRIVMTTTDDPNTVERYYVQQRNSRMRQAVVTGVFSDLPDDNWLIQPLDGGGSRITFAENCP